VEKWEALFAFHFSKWLWKARVTYPHTRGENQYTQNLHRALDSWYANEKD